MTRQWIRECSLSVGAGGEQIDVSELRLRFEVNQNTLQQPNVCTATITNLKPETAQKIKKEGKLITLEAGYQGGSGVIFKGEVMQVRIGRETPTDTYCTILAQSGDRAYNFATVSKTLAAGSTFKDQADVAIQSMKQYGIEAGFIADLGNAKMPRARTLFGMARDVLRDIAFSTKTSWSIQNQKLQIIKNDEGLPGSAFVVNSRTGMIGLPVQTIDGIVVRVLLNPKIIPGSIIQIDQGSIQQAAFNPAYTAEVNNAMIPSLAEDGFYKALVVNHLGDTRGMPWYSDIICTRADGQGPQPIRLANQGINVDPGR